MARSRYAASILSLNPPELLEYPLPEGGIIAHRLPVG